MPRIHFTQNLQRHLHCPSCTVAGQTVREALDAVFALHPRARLYVLDEQGELRKHMVIFVDAVQIRDRVGLTDPVASSGEVYVMQALSGGASDHQDE